MNDIEVSSIDLVEGGNVFKQGHYLTLGYVPRDEKGETVDLSGKTLNVSLWGRKGVVFEAAATYSGGVIRFTFDKLVAAGDYTVEFTATSSTDAKYRKKFPTNQHSGRIAIKQSADDLGVVGIQVYTVAQLKAELKTEQTALIGEAVAGFTVDSETKMARVSGGVAHDSLPERLEADKQVVARQLAEKADEADVFLKSKGININDWDEPTRQAILEAQGLDINYVLGEGNVKRENVANKAIDPINTTFMEPSLNLFNGAYVRNLGLSNELSMQVIAVDVNSRMLIIPIQGGSTYHIRKFSQSNRFRVGVSQVLPEVGTRMTTSSLNTTDPTIMYHSVATTAGDKYLLIYVSSTNEEPAMNVLAGADSLKYISPFPVVNAVLKSESVTEKELGKKAVTKEKMADGAVGTSAIENNAVEIKHLDFVKQTQNIFNGEYIEGVSINTDEKPIVIGVTGAVCVIIPIEGGTTYHVRKFESSDRMRIGLTTSTKIPAVGDVLTTLVAPFNEGHLYVEVPTTANDRFMVVGVSATSQKPKMQITKGTDSEEYIYPHELTEEAKTIFNATKSGNVAENKKFFTLGSPTVYFSEPNTIDPNGKNLAYFQAIYDSLESSPLVTPEVEGVDGLGNEIKSYTIEKPYPLAVNYSGYTPYPLNYNKRKKMKIIILSGVHGNERTSQVGLSNFIKKLVEDTEDKNLEFIRNNLILKVMPLANPSGIEANTRENHENVDLNREYVAQQQKETQIIVDYANKNLDAVALLDYHDSARTVSFWPAEENQIYHDIFYTVMANVNDQWTKENPAINNPVGEIVINPTTTNSQTFAHKLGMLGITVETSRNSDSLNGGVNWGWNADAAKYGNDLLINTILTIAKYYS